jgi:hypothetical protein
MNMPKAVQSRTTPCHGSQQILTPDVSRAGDFIAEAQGRPMRHDNVDGGEIWDRVLSY